MEKQQKDKKVFESMKATKCVLISLLFAGEKHFLWQNEKDISVESWCPIGWL